MLRNCIHPPHTHNRENYSIHQQPDRDLEANRYDSRTKVVSLPQTRIVNVFSTSFHFVWILDISKYIINDVVIKHWVLSGREASSRDPKEAGIVGYRHLRSWTFLWFKFLWERCWWHYRCGEALLEDGDVTKSSSSRQGGYEEEEVHLPRPEDLGFWNLYHIRYDWYSYICL